jgi:pimeloyl-ACP methyl ester carboxylesterase
VFKEQPCPVSIPPGAVVRCGTVSVPEDRQGDPDRQVVLSVAVAETTGDTTNLPPVIHLDGGPGGISLDNLAYRLRLYRKILAERPVIFFDQRGVGYSEPALDCAEVGGAYESIFTQKLPFDEANRILSDAYAVCQSRLEREGVSLAAYTTAASADDLRDIVVALGYPEVVLVGVSYGTRLAQVSMLRHQSEGWIAGAILDSVVPLQVEEQQEFWPNTQAAFKTIFVGCAAQQECSSHYPNLEETFYKTMEQLKDAPMDIKIFHPLTGKSLTIKLNDRLFFEVLYLLLYNHQESAKIPQIIDGIHRGETSVLREPLGMLLGVSATIYEGMNVSVQCTDEGMNLDLVNINQANAALDPVFQHLANEDAERFSSLCQSWGVNAADPSENQPLQTELPVLIFAGTQDPITPVTWGELLHASIPASYLYVFPGIGHGIWGTIGKASSCAEALTLDFLHDSSQPPDGACLSTIQPLEFSVPGK